MLNRHWPTALAVLAAVVLGWYLLYTELLVREMRREAFVQSRIYLQIISGLQDPRDGAAERTLLGLIVQVQSLGIPVLVVDADGVPSASANLPFVADPNNPQDYPRINGYIRELERRNPPIIEPGLGTVYIGDPPIVERLRWVPWLQVGALTCLLVAAAIMVRHNQKVERERIFATMARESAHQMATPLSSLTGWVEILRLPSEERDELASLPAVAAEMEADLERLEKVSRRFEWIGRPVRWEPVEVRDILRTLERYVRVRMPQFSQNVELSVDVPEGLPPVRGNAVLLEWALENLIKNALDALAGSDGRIVISACRESERMVGIRIEDNGPGVAPGVRSTLFDPGVTTKKGGWGVGLSLSRRIVEDVHRGRLALLPVTEGATFLVELPVYPSAA
ncbi:MAG: HAMP domain-containing histidine kinase [Gemmatimonadota bacterium]|jgi:signal transduction histidine kinase|nr:HAMP domain-containing histidine kinase [Gemmatimonadota bacterium]